MALKPVPTSGRFKVTSPIVITMNLEFNSACRKTKHSLFHWNTLMLQGLLILIWMCYKRRGLTIIGSLWRLQYINLYAIRSPWFIYEFLYNAHTYFIIIFIKGFRFWRQQIHRKSSTRKKWKYEWGATEKPAAQTERNQETEIKMKDAKKYTAIYCMTCRTSCRISDKIWSMNDVLQSHK